MGGHCLTDPAFNHQWRGEADVTWGDRLGIFASLRRYPGLVIAATLLGAMAGYAVAQRAPVQYQAEAVIILSDPGGPTVLGGGGTLSETDRKVYLAKQVELMRSRVVLERAVKLLGSGQSFGDLSSGVSVGSSADLAKISIVATTPDSQSAAAMANAVATAYEQVMAERATADAQRAIEGFEKLRAQYQAHLDAIPTSPDGRLTSRQQQLYGQIADVQQREQDLTARLAVYASGVEYLGRAEPPSSPSQPKPRPAALIGGLLGLLGSGAFAWWAAGRDPRAEHRGDPALILEAPLLGEVPRLPPPKKSSELATAPRLDPALEDAFHVIVASMEYELDGVSGKSIAVTSAKMGETKTSTAMQLANAASHQSRKVLFIDADVRMRHLSKRFDVAQGADERDAHKLPVPSDGRASVNEYLDRLVLTDSGMVLPVAADPDDPWHPAGSYRGVDVPHAVRTLGDMFDLVLIDTPPLLASSTAIRIAGQADSVVLIVSHRIPLNHLRDVRDRLDFVNSPLLGYVYVRDRNRGLRPLWRRATCRTRTRNRIEGEGCTR